MMNIYTTSACLRSLRRRLFPIFVIILVAVALLGTSLQQTHASGNIIVNTASDGINSVDGKCSISEAVVDANSGGANTTGGNCAVPSGITTINFSLPLNTTIDVAATLPVSTLFFIDGTGQNITLSGNNSISIFSISSTGNLGLNNITIANGFSSGDGGAINNSGGTITVTGTTFSNNSAAGDGGAIYSSTSTTSGIANSTFSNNTSTGSNGGGAIYSQGIAPLIITTSTFSGNTGKRGGAILSNSPLQLSFSTITNNSSASGTQGGGILASGPLQMDHDTISGNMAPGGNGGGIVTTNQFSIDSTTFSNNTGGAGGGLYSHNTTSTSGTITNSTFSGNTASIQGGGLYTLDSTAGATLTGDTFAGNTAPAGSGGNLYIGSSPVSVVASIFQQNGGIGNCVGGFTDSGFNFANDATCNLFTPTSKNNATLNMAALANNGGSTQTQKLIWPSDPMAAIPNGTFAANGTTNFQCGASTPDQRGQMRPQASGAKCTSGAIDTDFSVYNCPDPNNVASASNLMTCLLEAKFEGGSKIYTLSADITLTSILPSISTNVSIHGPGHFVDGNNAFQVFQVTSTGSLTLDNITVQHGRAVLGGGISNLGGTLNISNTTFTNNSAIPNGSGGAIYNAGGSANANIATSTFTDNTASLFGGGILNNDGNLTVTGSTFTGNTAYSGASSSGGAIENQGQVTVTTSTFTGNSSYFGGGLDNNGGNAVVEQSTFSNNTGHGEGGALDNFGGIMVVTSSTISGNQVDSSPSQGGGIGNQSGTLVLTSNTFYKNTAFFGGNVFTTDTVYLAGNVFEKTGAGVVNLYTFTNPTVIDNGYNIADDGSLPGSGTNSKDNAIVNLGPLDFHNGGTTKTQLPGTSSDALGAIPNGVSVNNSGTTLRCDGSTLDQNNAHRPLAPGGVCTSGSVEVFVTQHITLSAPVVGAINNGDTLDMGSTPLGTAKQVIITVTNPGVQPLSIWNNPPAVTGDFSASTLGKTALAGGASTTFTLTCNATMAGSPVTGTVSLYSDDPGTNPMTFTVSCNVVAPEIEVDAPNLTPITDGGTYDMGSVLAGNTLTRTITVKNIGTDTLSLTNALPTSPINAGPVGLTTVPAAGSTTFDLTCDATSLAAGSHSNAISFANNDHDENPFNFTASCLVLSADLPAPSGLAVTLPGSGSQTELDLSWTNNSVDESAINVERSTGGAWTLVSARGPGQTAYSDTGLACGTTYNYRVRAIRTVDGAQSNYSNVASNTTAACTLTAPTLVAPDNGSLTNNNTPTFAWNSVANADHYEFEIDNNSDFSSPILDFSQVPLTFFSGMPFADATTYYWRVRALETNGTIASDWSTPFSVTIDRVRLVAPTLSAPANNLIVGTLLPKFTWLAVTGATQYKLQVDDNSDFSSPLFTKSLGKVTTYTALSSDAFRFGSTYYWRVAAGDALNAFSNWSAVWTFPITIQKSPTNGAYSTSQTPAFMWTAVTGATNYELQVSPSTAFASNEVPFSGTALSYTVPVATKLPLGTHYWRIRVTTVAGTSPWMGPWMLTVTPSLPTAPVLSSPAANFMTISPTPSFQWVGTTAPNGGPFSYQIQIATTTKFYSPVQDVFQTGTTYTAGALITGTYYWRVRAINSENTTGPWSVVRMFSVNTTATPKLTAPANHSGTTLNRPKFTWTAVLGVKTYRISVYSVSSAGPLCIGTFLFSVSNLTTPTYTIPAANTALTVPGLYCWQVTASDSLSNTGIPSAPSFFTVDSTTNIKPPVAPTLTGPATGTVGGQQTLPDLTWSMPVTSTGNLFEVQIDTVSTFIHPVKDDVTPVVDQFHYTATSFISPLAAGTYSWRVRAINTNNVAGPYSAVRTFTIVTGTTPTLVSPANNSLTTSLHPVLTWQAVSGAKSYILDVSTNDSLFMFPPFLVNQKSVTTTSYTLTTEVLQPGVTYYWRVQSKDAQGNLGGTSQVFHFTTTVHLAPANGSSTIVAKPVFTWTAVPGATKYHITIDSVTSGNVVDTDTNLLTKFTPLTTLAPGAYTWFVTVTDPAIPGGPFSMPTWSFIVTAKLPGAPVQLTPTNNSVTGDNTPTFTWKAGTLAQTYELQISNSSTFTTPPVQDFVSTGPVLTYTANILGDGKYYWRVRSLNADNAPSAWTAVWAITIDTTAPPIPVVVGPANGTHTTNPSLTLRWNASAGASRYEIRFDTNNPPTTLPVPVGNVTAYVVSWPHQQASYYWQVRAIDAVGNTSDWSTPHALTIEAGMSSASIKPKPTTTAAATGEPTAIPSPESTETPTFSPPTNTPTAPTATPTPATTVEAESSEVVRTGTWTAQDTINASGGKYLYSSGQPGDALTLGFSGTHLEVVFVKHTAFGSFAVEIDGELVQTVTATGDQQFTAQVAFDNLAAGIHIVKVYATSGTVAIDAFHVEAVAALPSMAEPTMPAPTTPAPTATTPAPTTPPSTPTDTPTSTPEPTMPAPTTPAPIATTAAPRQTPVQTTVEAESATLSRTGNWTAESSPSASGGSYLYSSGIVGDALTLGFSGTQASVTYIEYPTFGSFAVEVDGIVKQTVAANAQQATFGAEVTFHNLAAGTHILRVYAVSGTVAIDAFQVEAVAALPTTSAPTTPAPTATTPAPTVEVTTPAPTATTPAPTVEVTTPAPTTPAPTTSAPTTAAPTMAAPTSTTPAPTTPALTTEAATMSPTAALKPSGTDTLP